jgi:hypothetical protein
MPDKPRKTQAELAAEFNKNNKGLVKQVKPLTGLVAKVWAQQGLPMKPRQKP